jgi:hypothetical protein
MKVSLQPARAGAAAQKNKLQQLRHPSPKVANNPHTICVGLSDVVVVVGGMQANDPSFCHVIVVNSCFKRQTFVNGSKFDAAHSSASRQAAQHSSLLCKTRLFRSSPSRTVSERQ